MMCTIEDLIAFRRQRERLIKRELALTLDTRFGKFDLFVYTSAVDPEPHLALTMGGVGVEIGGVVPVQAEPVLVRATDDETIRRCRRCPCKRWPGS